MLISCKVLIWKFSSTTDLSFGNLIKLLIISSLFLAVNEKRDFRINHKKVINFFTVSENIHAEKIQKMWKYRLIINYKANSYITMPSMTENCQDLEFPVVSLPRHSFRSFLELLSHFMVITSWLFFVIVHHVCIPTQYH